MDGIDICVWAVDGLFSVLLSFFVYIRLGTFGIPVYTLSFSITILSGNEFTGLLLE